LAGGGLAAPATISGVIRNRSPWPLFSLIVPLVFVLGCTEGGDQPSCRDGLAFEHVGVIDGLGNPPLEDQTVAVCDGRIAVLAASTEARVPRGAKAVDMSGRWIVPGFVDMHAHVTMLPFDSQGGLVSEMSWADSEHALRTLVAFGVTTVRNPAAPAAEGVALREAVASGELVGPRILTAGEALNPREADYGPFVAVPDEASVRAEVARQAEIGVDYIKAYAALPPELLAIVVEAAHAHGLEVIAHLQRTDWTEAARLGVDQIAHGAPWSTSYLPAEAQAGYRGTFKGRMDWLEQVDFDGPPIQEMLTELVEHGVSIDPTLLAYRTKFFGDDPRHTQHPEMDLAPPTVREQWQLATFTDDWTAADYARGHAVWPRMLEFTRRLYEGGVFLTAGSDLPNPWVIPGVSLHEELQLLADAGIPPLEVLKIATWNGARALGLDEEVGSVEVGKRADLVILAANPLRMLANTRAIELVLLDGKPYSPGVLLTSGS